MSIKNHHKDMIKIHTFPNGFRVIYQKPKQLLPITAVHVFCKVGSIYETENVRGVCHFVEHMCFKGTQKIIHPNEIFANYDEIGAYINAYTEKEYTCYTLKCSDIFVENSTHILADMMLNSTFPPSEFKKEQKVIVEENIRNINDDEWFFFDKLNAIFYAGSSFAYPIDSIEYHPTANTLKYKNVLDWYNYYYHPENMVMSITSNLSFTKILHILKTSFFVKNKKRNFELQFNYTLDLLPILSKDKGNHRIELYKKKGVSTNYVGVGFRTCNKKNPDRYPLKLLNHILNGLSGRLFTLLREKHGLTYRSNSVLEFKEHTGYLLIYAETDPHKTIKDGNSNQKGVLPIILQLIHDLIQKGITTEELERFKGNMKGTYLMNLQEIDTLTSYNGMKYILSSNAADFRKNFVDYNDIYETYIDKITKEDIHSIIRKYFVVENRVIYILGETVPTITQVNNCLK
jgi:predicted Zn-dependent peptidase